MPLVRHPEFGSSPVNYTPMVLSDDPDEQVSATIDLMSSYAREDASTPEIQGDARAALASYPDASPEEAVFRYLKPRIVFQHDGTTAQPLAGVLDFPIIEVLIRPRDLSAMCNGNGCRRVGDCDDFSMYGAAMLRAMGRNPKFVTVAASPVDPSVYSHVYLASYDEAGNRTALDISHGQYPGWEYPDRNARRREWSIESFPWLPVIAGVVLLGGTNWLK